MIELDKMVRSNIRNLTPYSSARDEVKSGEGIFLDANESPFGTYNRYPDPSQQKLKAKISSIKKVKPEHIFLGNGSDEVIDLLFRIFCEPGMDKALAFSPTYGMYQVCADLNAVELMDVPLLEDCQIDLERVKPLLANRDLKLIFICSPNNPTGNSINEVTINFLLDNFSGIVVLDEAYIDFSPHSSWNQRIDQYPNLVVLQTFSKAWSSAGLRLGMAVTNRNIVQYLNKVKPPYNISTPNQEMALESIQNKAGIKEKIQWVLAEKVKLEIALMELEIVEKVFPSDANFLLVKVTDADQIYQALITNKFIVRNRNKVVDNCLRITIGSPVENELLINALKIINDEKSIVSR